MSIVWALDVDYTLLRDTNQIAQYVCERIPELQISSERIAELRSQREFELLPEVQAYVEDDNQYERITAVTQEARTSEQVLAEVPPVPGAVEAVARLAAVGRILYVTCRRPEQIALTRVSLSRYGFPDSHRVFSCDDYHYKYLHAASYADPGDEIIVVDDMAIKVLYAFNQVVRDHVDVAKAIVRRLALVAFARPEQLADLPEKIPFEVYPLPSWEKHDVDQMLAQL